MLQRAHHLVAFALLALFPFAVAQEPGKEAPKPADSEASYEIKAPEPGTLFLEKFDLNKDGKVDWDEYQKVRSGFTGFDANGDGVVTSADFKIIMERRQVEMQKTMQQAMQKRMKQGMRQDWGRRMRGAMGQMGGAMGPRGGPGMGGPRWMQQEGAGPGGPGMQQGRGPGMGPRWMQQQGRGQGGPGRGPMGPGFKGPRGPMADGDVCPWCQQPCAGAGAGQGMGPGPGRGPGRGMRWGFGAPGAPDDDNRPAQPPGPPQR